MCENSNSSKSAIGSDVLEVQKRTEKKKFCYHCNKYVSNSTFYRHRALYFDEVSQSWKTTSNGGFMDNRGRVLDYCEGVIT